MKRKFKNNFLKFSLVSVFLSGTLISIPFVTDLNNSKTEKNNSINNSKKIDEKNLVKQLNEKYVEKNKIYTVNEAKEIINKLSKNEIKILKEYTESEQKDFDKKSEKNISDIKEGKLNLSKKFYTSWYWVTLSLFWGVEESKNISNVFSAISIGAGVASLSNIEVPGLDLILGISSLVSSGLSLVFANPGPNGVKLNLLFGFIPTYFGGY